MFCPLAFIIRGLHIIHSITFWAIPLLFVEIGFVTIALLGLMMGMLRTMQEIDRESPIMIFPFCYFSKNLKKMNDFDSLKENQFQILLNQLMDLVLKGYMEFI
jgi:hypothetical protein